MTTNLWVEQVSYIFKICIKILYVLQPKKTIMKLMIIMNVRKLYTCMSAAITSWITLVWSNYLKTLGTKILELLKHFQFHTSQHGLILIPNFRAWADTFWGIWGIFGQLISTHFGTVSPLSMFFINQPLFLKKN